MARWLVKTEPEEYSYQDLERAGRDVWDGVKNAQAQRNMRECKKGDLALIYHTAPDKALVGVARVTGEHRPDPKAFGRI